MIRAAVDNVYSRRFDFKSFSNFILAVLGHRRNFFCQIRDKSVLDSAVQSGKFIPFTGKIFREEFTINIMEKNNTGRKGKATIAKFKNGIFPVRQ